MRGKIPIRAAQRISEQSGCPVVIVFGLEASGERFTVTTYGATKAMCRHAADLSKQFAEAVLNGTVAPSDEEPMELPNEPALWDGLARGGPRRKVPHAAS